MSLDKIKESKEIEEKNEIIDPKEVSEKQENQESKEQNNNIESQESKEINNVKLISSKDFKTLTNAAPLIGEKRLIIDDSEFSFSIGELKEIDGISMKLDEIKPKINVYFIYEASFEKLKSELKFLEYCRTNEEIIPSLYQLFNNDKIKVLKKEDKYIMEFELEFSLIGLATKFEIQLEKIEIPIPVNEEDLMSSIKNINEKYVELKNELNKLKKNSGTFSGNENDKIINNLDISSLAEEVAKKINIKDKILEVLKDKEILGVTSINEIINEKLKSNEEKEKILNEKIEKMEIDIKTQINDINKILEKINEEKKSENESIKENLKKKEEEGHIIKQNIEKIEGDIKNIFEKFNKTVEDFEKQKVSMNKIINENFEKQKDDEKIFQQNIEKKHSEIYDIINKMNKTLENFESNNYLEQKLNEQMPKIIKSNKYSNYITLSVNINENDIGNNIRLLKQKEIYKRKFNFEIDDIIVQINDEGVPIKYNNTNSYYKNESEKIYEFYWIFQKKGTYNIKIIFKNNLTNCYQLFSGCKNIISIDCSHFDCSEVRDCSYMFSGCSALKKIEFGKLDFSLVTNFSYMFDGCGELEELNISNLNTKNALYFNYMFNQCKKLKKIDISNFNGSSCQQIDGMFYNCEILNEIDMLNWDMKNIKQMNYLFYGCKNLTKIKMSCNFNDFENVAKDSTFKGISDSGNFFLKKDVKCKMILNELPTNWDWNKAD